jgi:phosphoglycolate phosphatase-like HAD superfamily hydrolase
VVACTGWCANMISAELQAQLAQHGITDYGEVSLREALEAHSQTYTLIKLAPWPARRWKCRYRLMIGDKIHDAQSAAEAYALALLAVLDHP